MAPGTVKVLIAGNIYSKLALVRRFLEDAGYEVVGDAGTKQNVIRAVQAGRPDAVIIDEDFIDGGPVGTIPRIRSAQPGAKIVVFTSGPPVEETAPKGADGYLEKGAPLSALTSMLGRVFADRSASIDAIAGTAGAAPARTAPVDIVAAAKAAAMTAHRGPAAPLEPVLVTPVEGSDDAPSRERRFGGFRLAALVAGIVLIMGSLVSMIVSNDTEQPPTVAAAPSPSAIIEQPQSDELQMAYDTLDGMITALHGANYVLATVDAQQLMRQRETAQAAGFSIGALDDEITSRLNALVGTLPTRVITPLQDVLGSLFPRLVVEPGGGGSTVVLGNASPNTGSGGTSSGGDATGGGGSTGGNGGGGGEEVTLGPGDGRAWGLSHKPPFGGWHGQKPKHDAKPKHHGKP